MWNKEFWYNLDELLEACYDAVTDNLGFASLLYYIDYVNGNTGIYKDTLREVGISMDDLKIHYNDAQLLDKYLTHKMELVRRR